MKRLYIGSGSHTVEVYENDDYDEFIGLLTHHVRHSPDGFSWGYLGSGPAELARCLLIDAIEERCQVCKGSNRVGWSAAADAFIAEEEIPLDQREEAGIGACFECMGEPVPSSLYQRFKEEFVATWPQDGGWKITRDEILAWVAKIKEAA